MLRIIPIGGVLLAVLIVLLAISPPREAARDVSPDMVLARGPLIDRHEHPEWPQLLIKTAFRRAGEILKLRDLPNTPTVVTPIPLPPVPPVAKVTVAPAQQADVGAAKSDVVPAAPAPAADAITATPPGTIDDVKSAPPAAMPAVPVQARSERPAAATTAPAVVPAPVPNAEATPAVQSGEAAAVPPLAPVPNEPTLKVAVLPLERPSTDPDRDEVTGTVSASSDVTTIPVDIGETSSTELPVALPPERPSILRTIQRERSSRHHHRTPRRPRTSAKPAAPTNVQPASQVNLFEWLSQESNRANPPKPAPQGKTASGTPAYPPTAFYPVTSP